MIWASLVNGTFSTYSACAWTHTSHNWPRGTRVPEIRVGNTLFMWHLTGSLGPDRHSIRDVEEFVDEAVVVRNVIQRRNQ